MPIRCRHLLATLPSLSWLSWYSETLHLVFNDQHCAIPTYPRDPSPYRPSYPLQKLVSQDNTGCHVSGDDLGEPNHPSLDVSNNKNDGMEKQQHQEFGQEEQRERSSNSGVDGDSDDDNDQDSENPCPAKRCQPSPSSDPTSELQLQAFPSAARSSSTLEWSCTVPFQAQPAWTSSPHKYSTIQRGRDWLLQLTSRMLMGDLSFSMRLLAPKERMYFIIPGSPYDFTKSGL